MKFIKKSFLVLSLLSFTEIFSKIWGKGLKTFSNSLAFLPFLKENRTSNATNKPSPVVANFPKII